LSTGDDGVARCWWCGTDPDYVAYHDQEWGMPTSDDRRLFETLCLEGFQAGLSWLTILRKRPRFREVFSDFDIDTVARYTDSDLEGLMGDAGIVRHRGKITSTINNARRARCLRSECGSLAAYVWRYEPDRQGGDPAPAANGPASPPASSPASPPAPGPAPSPVSGGASSPAPPASPPAREPAVAPASESPESRVLSRDLRRRGWTFVGPTTVYAFMQSAGLVDDHVAGCSRRERAEAARAAFHRPG
jgi:DNA-3-methyladenine glycosylase I